MLNFLKDTPLAELKRQMIEAVNDEYNPKIRDCSIRIAYFERVGA